ncbi:MAG TPA: UBP-type zinc finger domain-containing protein [Povalibacter sp.]
MPCDHVEHVHPVAARSAGCEECLRTGSPWVHLRLCLECGHVGCCDSSPNRHATRHFHTTNHPVIVSYEPGEQWAWCYVDSEAMEVPQRFLKYLRA